MPRKELVVNNLSNGIATDTSPINPASENFLVDASNVYITDVGTIKPRLGIDLETGGSATAISVTGVSNDDWKISTYLWEDAGGIQGQDVICLRTANYITFFSVTDSSVSNNSIGSIDLTSFLNLGYTSVDNVDICMYAGAGYLFVASSVLSPFYVTYNSGGITNSDATVVTLNIRDFDGIDDGVDAQTRPAALSNTHEYNLRNNGWITLPNGSDPISTYQSTVTDGKYPSTNTLWYLGKDSSGVFQPSLLDKQFFGDTKQAGGHYIINALNQDRSTVSGIAGLTTITAFSNPTWVTFFAGRVWWGGVGSSELGTTVFFSQIIKSPINIQRYYQRFDPTSEQTDEANKILDNDGGTVQVADIGSVRAAVPFENVLLLFGVGVKMVKGGITNGFTATDYSVDWVADSVGFYPRSIVVAPTGVFGMTNKGIALISTESGKVAVSDISKGRVRQWYHSLPEIARLSMQGSYVAATEQIVWAYTDITNVQGRPSPSLNHTVELSTMTGQVVWNDFYHPSCFLCGPPIYHGVLKENQSTYSARQSFDSPFTSFPDIKYHTGKRDFSSVRYPVIRNTSATTASVTFGHYRRDNFQDFGVLSGSPTNTYPYGVFPPSTGQSLQLEKSDLKLTVFVAHSETTYAADGGVNNASDLQMAVLWDWFGDNSVQRKVSEVSDVYQPLRIPIADGTGSQANIGARLIETTRAIRGKGKSFTVAFAGKDNKDFELLGFSATYDEGTPK